MRIVIERVARAIAAADDECDWDERPDQSETSVLHTPKEVFRERARAAIAELGEDPTDAMVDAALAELPEGSEPHHARNAIRAAIWAART